VSAEPELHRSQYIVRQSSRLIPERSPGRIPARLLFLGWSFSGVMDPGGSTTSSSRVTDRRLAHRCSTSLLLQCGQTIRPSHAPKLSDFREFFVAGPDRESVLGHDFLRRNSFSEEPSPRLLASTGYSSPNRTPAKRCLALPQNPSPPFMQNPRPAPQRIRCPQAPNSAHYAQRRK